MSTIHTKIELYSKLLREFEAEIGTRDLSELFLESLVDAIKVLKVQSAKEFCEEFAKLRETIVNTEPKFGILNYHFACLTKSFEEGICSEDYDEKKWKSLAVKQIKEIMKHATKQKKKLLKYAEKLDVDEKVILIHDHSHTVQDVLAHFKAMKKKFKVIVAEQDFEKTQGNIERLHQARIPFQVVPTYMLSHMADQIDMLFFGGLTFKDSMNFVMSPGTHGVISEFHAEGIPIYIFFNTNKFSLWKSKPRGEIFMRKHVKKHYSKSIQYEAIKYSHDRVPVHLFTKIVTNDGVFSPEALEKLFKERLEDHQKIMGSD